MTLLETASRLGRAAAHRAQAGAARALARALEAPEPRLRRWGARGPHPEGLELDAQTAVLVRLADVVLWRPLESLPAAEARRAYARSSMLTHPARPPEVRSRDLALETPTAMLRARLYEPPGLPSRAPCLLYFHGGGFVIGDLDSHDATCAELARDAGVCVVAVDYRLAPEHPFPAAADDAFAAYAWLLEHAAELGVDPDRIAVGGDSAGGNLAAVASLAARERGVPLPRLQVLIYPATDMTRSSDSHRSFAEGYLLTTPLIDWFLANYLPPGQDLRDWRCSPLFAESHGGLPPAIVVTAGFDPLRDEGRAYAEALESAGVEVDRIHAPGLVHGFATMTGPLRAARDVMRQVAGLVRSRLGA